MMLIMLIEATLLSLSGFSSVESIECSVFFKDAVMYIKKLYTWTHSVVNAFVIQAKPFNM